MSARSAGLGRLAAIAMSSWIVGCGPPLPKEPAPIPRRPVVEPPSAARAVLDGVSSRATKAGAGALDLVAHGVGTEGEKAGAFVLLPKSGCELVTAAGSSGVTDVDLFAFDDDGTSVGADESPSASAAIMLCPPHPERVYVMARVVSGGGIVAVGAQEVAVDKVRAVAAAVGARGRDDDSGRLDSWPGLEAKVREHRAALGGHWEDVRRLAAPLDPRAPTRTTFTIEPRRCADVLVVPSDEVSAVEVVAETSDGRIAARAQAQGHDRTLLVCSETGEALTLSMRPRLAQGVAAVIVGRSREGAEPEIARTVRIDRPGAPLSLDAAEKALDAELAKASYGPARSVAKGQAKVGSRASVDVKLAKGCTRLDVVPGAPSGPVRASLWDDRGLLLSEGEGTARAPLFACGAGGSARLDVEGSARPGPFAVSQRPFQAVEPSLLHEPLAASRLLARAEAEGIDATSLVDVREIKLAHTSLAKEPFEVKPATCREIVVALGAKGSGLELRLVDDATGADSIVRARFVVSDRVCAGPTPRRFTAEVRLGDGEGGALAVARDVAVE
jgi:hypothetical protein